MSIFSPIVFLFRATNNVLTAICVGQIAWIAYKKVREMNKDKLKASEIKEKFISEHIERTGEEPSEKVVEAVLRTHNAIEHPIQDYVQMSYKGFLKTFNECLSKEEVKEEVTDIKEEPKSEMQIKKEEMLSKFFSKK